MEQKKNVHPTARMHLDVDRGRAELWDTLDGVETFIGFVGFTEEIIGGQQVTRLQHTIIDPAHGRKGYARCLVTLLLDHLAEQDARLLSECSYIDDYLSRPDMMRNYEVIYSLVRALRPSEPGPER